MIFACLIAVPLAAQRYPERKYIRGGNSLYGKGSYPMAGVMYMKAMAHDSLSYEARFGLLDAMYKQGNYDAAAQGFAALASDTANVHAPLSYYNQGNALFQQKKYQEAIEAYKNSLRLNPSDREAKFNLAYAKKMLEQQQDQDNKDNKDDKNKDKDKDKDQQDQQDQQQQQQQQGQMTREEAQRMLDAVQMSEDKARAKLDSARTAPARGGKNW
ncbi:MAG: tetratricopeptide repeat protein [Rikenellaceae bacterium]|nr:tetratricopeptide repeat protein [Rikenellaceae bacterium]